MRCQVRSSHQAYGPFAFVFAWALAMACSVPARAHPLLGDCVQHSVYLKADPSNIDIEVELTFTDMRSMAERRRMDKDRDWSITDEERDGYARFLADFQPDRFGLAIDGRPLRLIPLHEPEVDLLGKPQVAPIRHVIRLFYFARTPAFLKPGSEIVLSDRLWPEAPAMLAMIVTGDGGVRITTPQTDPISPAGNPGATRLLRARCLAVPAEGIGKAETPPDRPIDLPAPPATRSALTAPFPRPPWAAALIVAVVVLIVRQYRPHRRR